ncbi:hypothetical protein [Flavobacterium sp.]|uniref:hypothetical protein n=1 Tax=Flavobacterium sp. TaxID=239 RepID=UPI002607AD32|nr:hypothetical protein [Flavobacterium sp.]MDG2432569.1 hypothetical protein [Flavobacterium sp.]
MKIKGLTIIFFLTLLITVWINFVNYKFSVIPFFLGKADKLEGMIDGFCLSYITGYFFYFINVYLVERTEKKSILPYISFKIKLVLDRNNHFIQVLKKDIKLRKNYPTKEEFEILLEKKNLDDLKIFNFEKYNFLEYLKYNRNSTLKNINKILKSGKYVDEELKEILLSLKESLFLKKDYAFNSQDFDLSKMKTYYNVLYNYSQDIKALQNYFDRNLKKYYCLNYPKHFRNKIKNSL